MKCEFCNKEADTRNLMGKEVCVTCAIEHFPDQAAETIMREADPEKVVTTLTMLLTRIIKNASELGINVRSITMLDVDKNTSGIKFEIDSSGFAAGVMAAKKDMPKLDPTGRGYDA